MKCTMLKTERREEASGLWRMINLTIFQFTVFTINLPFPKSQVLIIYHFHNFLFLNLSFSQITVSNVSFSQFIVSQFVVIPSYSWSSRSSGGWTERRDVRTRPCNRTSHYYDRCARVLRIRLRNRYRLSYAISLDDLIAMLDHFV